MFSRLFHLFLFLAAWTTPLFSSSHALKIRDIPHIMEKFFQFHIENRELSPLIVKRSIKIYLENFDREKVYFLESEILPYLNMSDKVAENVYQRVRRGDYRDFIELHALMQKSIIRAEKVRGELAEEFISEGFSRERPSYALPAHFARSEGELYTRQKNRMVRFFLFHKARTEISSEKRRALVVDLFEKKVRKGEYSYLFVDGKGNPFLEEEIEHLFSLRLLKAFAKSLDTHTSFFSPEEAYEMRLSLEKQFEGVGIVLSEGIDGVMIAELVPGSPALASGQVQVNDLLVEIDGKSLSGLELEEVLELLKGKDRGSIVLGLKRSGERALKRVSLKKQPIVMQEERIQTSYEKFGNGIIGKIALFSFYESPDGHSSERDIKEAIRKFREKGELVGLVLDLRENVGGFLSQAVKVSGLFLSNGVVVISKYGNGEKQYLRNIASKSFYNGPLVVLTSKMSASAAEIVAQALQDYGVAVIAGDLRTFGKGSIQYQTVTDAKADLFFKVTVGRYYTVSGKSTQIEGVIADIVVPTQYAPYNIGERFLEYPLPADRVDSAYLDALSDLDPRTKKLFEERYLPYLQRKVGFWKKSLETLKKNSQDRIARDPMFQAFLRHQETIRARQDGLSVNTVDEPIQIGLEDLQMIEGVNIVKDMILIEAEQNAPLASTGSDSL